MTFPSAPAAAARVRDSFAFDRTWLATGKVGDWTFVWEDNGFQGAGPDRAKSLATETTFVSRFWNVNSLMSFTLARDGQIVRRFDPLFHDDDPSPVPAVGDPLPDEADLDWETEPRLSGLTLLSRMTGDEPSKPGLAEPLRSHVLGPHLLTWEVPSNGTSARRIGPTRCGGSVTERRWLCSAPDPLADILYRWRWVEMVLCANCFDARSKGCFCTGSPRHV